MGAMDSILQPELRLGLKPTFIPKTITDFLQDISMVINVSEKSSKLDEFITKLEEEMNKIDGLKRELPLCMLLLNDAILTLKEEIKHCESSSVVHPVIEESSPKDVKDNKMNWMSSVQLWTSTDLPKIDTSDEKKNLVEIAKEEKISPTPMKFQYNNGGGAFVPFKGLTYFPLPEMKKMKEDKKGQSVSLSGPVSMKITSTDSGTSILNSRYPSVSMTNSTSNSPQNPSRKQRRCWSPDLHKRFINALQQLGGSQVATPKQIRELMKVDGLTNDEVKSHLQKFRLHSRRVSNGTSKIGNEQVLGLGGGLWDQFGCSKSSNSQSGSPTGPLELAANGGDHMEDEEDGKSESYGWKGHLPIARECDV